MKVDMVKQLSLFLMITLAHAVAVFGSQRLSKRREKDHAQFVTLCKLTKSPEDYTHHRVTTAGIMVKGVEQSFLYDPQCNTQGQFVWIEFGGNAKSTVSATRTLERLTSHPTQGHTATRARVVLTGIFYSP